MLGDVAISSWDSALVLSAFDGGPVYVGCLIFGGGLVLLSALGGHHHDVDAGAGLADAAGADALDGGGLDAGGLDASEAASAMDTAHGGSATELFAWFSLRFVIYFVASFGLVGTVLSYMSELGSGPVLAISLIAGLAVGQSIHWLMRSLMRSGGNSQTSARDFLNKTARVTVALSPGRRGQVAVPVRDSEVYLTAVSQRGDESFAVGDQVVVREYSCGTASVISRREHTFRQETGERAET